MNKASSAKTNNRRTPSRSESKSSRSGIRHMEQPTQSAPPLRQSPERKRGKRQRNNRQTNNTTTNKQNTTDKQTNKRHQWQHDGHPPDTGGLEGGEEGRRQTRCRQERCRQRRCHPNDGQGCSQRRRCLYWMRLSQSFKASQKRQQDRFPQQAQST